jgi:hypothetical protein
LSLGRTPGHTVGLEPHFPFRLLAGERIIPFSGYVLCCTGPRVLGVSEHEIPFGGRG